MSTFWTIFRFTLVRQRWNLLGWGVPLFLLGLITAPFYDLVAENQARLLPIIQTLQPVLKGFIGGEDAALVFTPQGFISLRYFTFLPIVLGTFGAIAGSGLLAADEERGVLDFLLAHPVGRMALFFGRLAAITTVLSGILVLGWLGLWCGVLRSEGLDLSFWRLGLPYISVFAVTALFGAMALAFSMVS